MNAEDESPTLEQARDKKLRTELQQRVSTTLTHAGLALFPAGEEGSDPGGAVVNLESEGVAVGWFTSDALIDQDSEEGFIKECEAAMVNAMAAILMAAGMSVTLCPWDIGGDSGRTSLFIPLNSRN